MTLLTPDPMIGRELQRMAADLPLRKALARLGVRFVLEHSILEWHGDGATVVSHLDGSESRIGADTLVTATTNVAADWLSKELEAIGMPFQAIGDGVAPRQAPYAFYEGRKVALAL